MVNVFDITQFGAVGDGVTDCTAAIQEAMDAASGCMGKVVVITDSTCDLSKKLIEENDIKIVPLYVNFDDAIYSIEQRPVTVKAFDKNLTYNGLSQIPEVKLEGVLPKDGDILFVITEGDTKNAGEYTLKTILTNYNYR